MPTQEIQLNLILGVLYPTITVDDPMDQLDHVMRGVIGRNALGASPDEYLQAIRAALASDLVLSDLIEPYHTEADVRRFLSAVQSRLEAKSQS